MKNRTTATVWILLIFLVGVLFGGTTSYLMMRPSGAATFDKAETDDASKDSKRTHQRLYEQMADELQLTAEQRSKIREMLEAKREQYRAITEEKIRKSRELRRDTRSKLAEILTPTQMEEFNEFMRRHREKNHPKSKNSHKDRED